MKRFIFNHLIKYIMFGFGKEHECRLCGAVTKNVIKTIKGFYVCSVCRELVKTDKKEG